MKTTEEKKQHYRAVLKSNHLGSADLEDLIEQKKPLIFTIKNVKQEYNVEVAGRKGNFNIAYFIEPIKPLVLNSTNAKTVRYFAGGSPFVQDWNNIKVELYIDDQVKMKGEIVSGVRIKPIQPQIKVKQFFSSANFEKALAVKATIEQIEKSYQITQETKDEYLKLLNSEK